MENQTTTYGPRKLGKKEFQAQQDAKVMTTESGIVYGKRKGGGPGAAAFTTLRDSLHSFKVDEVVERLVGVSDPQHLQALHAIERSNPDYTDGRKGVLNAIEERRGELIIEDAGGEPETKTPPEAGQDGGEGAGEGEPDEAIVALRAKLEEGPGAFDDLLTEELSAGEPRPQALTVFREIEAAREEPRAQVLELIDEYTAAESGEE